ncbi:MAG TPA: ABC transporter substrate-binding protein [Stellaceae bacterium]|nr:ABC transporter substrate-binding protein [Stellaceae bacterium]
MKRKGSITRRQAVAGIGTAAVLTPLLRASQSAAAEPSWDAIVAAAKKEGALVIKGAPGSAYTTAFTEGFKKKYPDIQVSYTGLNGFESIPRIQRERAAGIYGWDIYIGGTPSILSTLKPAGAFAPLPPVMKLPEVIDDKAWFGGLNFGWQDHEKKFTFAFDLTVAAPAYVNWDFVKHDDLKTLQDLMKPQFSGKMVWDDPRIGGPGIAAGCTMVLNGGDDFLAKFLSTQKVAYSTNGRQEAQWVVEGKYPIGLAVGSQDLEPFWQQGLGKNVTTFMPEFKTVAGGPGFGVVAMLDKAPHPNAAAVYVNWLLSKEGQMEYVKSGRNSRRLDVPPSDPALAAKPGMHYQDIQSEDSIPLRNRVSEISKANIKA